VVVLGQFRRLLFLSQLDLRDSWTSLERRRSGRWGAGFGSAEQRGVGMGLDEKAVEAVRQYKFKPALQNGKPVPVDLYIDVNFQIF
jgi:hypothetical protein